MGSELIDIDTRTRQAQAVAKAYPYSIHVQMGGPNGLRRLLCATHTRRDAMLLANLVYSGRSAGYVDGVGVYKGIGEPPILALGVYDEKRPDAAAGDPLPSATAARA